MIDAETIEEILSLYAKHGWTLRRVLLSEKLKEKLGSSEDSLFGDAELFDSFIDGLWFSRESKDNKETWELRYLRDAPFALVEVIEKNLDIKEREAVLRNTEMRLNKIRSKVQASH